MKQIVGIQAFRQVQAGITLSKLMAWMSRALLASLIILVASCASRPGSEVLKTMQVNNPATKLVTVFVATTRSPAGKGELGFTPGRSPVMTYAKYVISIPPSHKPSVIDWPKGKPDPAKDFVTVSSQTLSAESFQRAIAAEPKTNSDKSAHLPMLFVHGFNYNFQESLYQIAQMTTDADNRITPILFAWPSDASVTGYVADRDSIMYSRDQLASLMLQLTSTSGSKQIIVAAHSMGCYLTVEVLRQLRLTGKNEVISKLQVALASPDIDLDVFKSEIAAIGPLNPPMTIMVAGDDRALEVSSKITGDRPRLGSVDVNSPDIQALAATANLQFIDFSELKSDDGLNHNRFFGLPAVFRKLESQGALESKGAFGIKGIFHINGATIQLEHL